MLETQSAVPASIVWGTLNTGLNYCNPILFLEELELQSLTNTLPATYIQ